MYTDSRENSTVDAGSVRKRSISSSSCCTDNRATCSLEHASGQVKTSTVPQSIVSICGGEGEFCAEDEEDDTFVASDAGIVEAAFVVNR